METIVDISYYPLKSDFVTTIEGFIEKLNKHPDIEASTNELSTHVKGDYDRVMKVLNEEMKKELEAHKGVFVIKVIGR